MPILDSSRVCVCFQYIRAEGALLLCKDKKLIINKKNSVRHNFLFTSCVCICPFVNKTHEKTVNFYSFVQQKATLFRQTVDLFTTTNRTTLLPFVLISFQPSCCCLLDFHPNLLLKIVPNKYTQLLPGVIFTKSN